MEKQKDNIEERIKEDLYSEAEAIRQEVDSKGTWEVSRDIKNDIRLKLQEKIDAYEKERVYANLSEEDREAMELGKKIQKEQRESDFGKRIHGKRRWKVQWALAAALVLVLAIGMTSMGGAERIASVIEQVVGERKVVKVNSDEGNKVVENDEEEKSYQEITGIFGVEPVRLMKQSDIEYIQMDLDEDLQVAEILYKYNGKNIIYIMSAGYYISSFGFDVEDELIEKETIEVGKNKIELSVYKVKETGEIRCSAHFTYQKIEYFLVGTMNKHEFELILKNLYFS